MGSPSGLFGDLLAGLLPSPAPGPRPLLPGPGSRPRPHAQGVVRRYLHSPAPLRSGDQARRAHTTPCPLTPRPLALTANIRPMFRPAPVVLSFGAVSVSIAPVGLWAFLPLFLRKFIVYPKGCRTFTTPEDTNPPPQIHYTLCKTQPTPPSPLSQSNLKLLVFTALAMTTLSSDGGGPKMSRVAFGLRQTTRPRRSHRSLQRLGLSSPSTDGWNATTPRPLCFGSPSDRAKGPWCLAGFDSLRPF